MLVFGGVITLIILNYPWVFSKRVEGRILAVERVTTPEAIVSGSVKPYQIYSFSVLIQGKDGRLYTASSEDRQWQVAKKGYCVEALLYRYPPWELEKANTFFNARVKELRVCEGESPPDETPTAPDPLPTPVPSGDTLNSDPELSDKINDGLGE